MPAYMITFVRVQDPELFSRDYVAHAHPVVVKHGGKALSVTDNLNIKEGTFPESRLVIMEFPSLEDAEAFYADPDYQPLIEMRNNLATTDTAIVNGMAQQG